MALLMMASEMPPLQQNETFPIGRSTKFCHILPS